jgi:chromosome partitioning protein
LRAAFVVSRKVVRTVIGRDVTAALDQYRLPVLNTAICQRIAFAECAIHGRVVRELDRSAAARAEIAALSSEVLGHLP